MPALTEGERAAISAEAHRLDSEGKSAEAAALLAEGYAKTGDPDFLYSEGIAWRRAGDCHTAIELLSLFIEHEPDPRDAADAQRNIDACRDFLAAQGEPVGPSEQTDEDTPPRPPPSNRARKDALGLGLLGGGAAVATAGVVTLFVSRSLRAPRDESESEFRDRRRRFTTTRVVGITLVVAGGAALLGSAIRFAIVGQSDRNSASAARRIDVRGTAVHVTF